jgi:CubicO group peptidase (beta-lactamase class C family)
MHINFVLTNRFIILIALSLFSAQFALAQNSTAPSAQQIAAKIDEYMNAATKVDRFSGSVLVARDGTPVVSKGYGMASIELDVPNTPQTVFRLGSITKQFTAMAIMMLQERGKLTVGDSICKHLADCPAAWQTITIRHLLTHTSGIPNYTALPDYRKTQSLPVTHASLIERFKDKPLEFAPGEKFKYSNSGYYLLGVIIERVSGSLYADFLHENIFVPLAMTSTGYDSSRSIIKNRAAGYAMQGDSIINASYLDMSIPYAAGSLYSTVEDLLRWDQALYTEKLISRKSLDEMFTPFRGEYGYGWNRRKKFDRQALEHSGGIDGFNTFISRYPAERLVIIVLSNTEYSSGPRIGSDLAAIVFGAPYKIPQERKAIAVASSTLDKYVGQYHLPNTVIAITNENGKLMWQANGQPKVELSADSETDFFAKSFDVQVRFIKDGQGRVTGLVRNRGGIDTTAQKIK